MSDHEIDLAYQALAAHGVTRERARSVHNGIDVLVTRLARENASLRAKIDALMLEFCPDEMSAEQRAEWAKHQSEKTAMTSNQLLTIINICNERVADPTLSQAAHADYAEIAALARTSLRAPREWSNDDDLIQRLFPENGFARCACGLNVPHPYAEGICAPDWRPARIPLPDDDGCTGVDGTCPIHALHGFIVDNK